MKERPILFSSEMVRAILSGRKTQTRRVMKPDIRYDANMGMCWGKGKKWSGWFGWPMTHGKMEGLPGSFYTFLIRYNPYGLPLDKLWVRESFADLRGMGFGNHPATGKPFEFSYKADIWQGSDADRARIDYGVRWKPSIHMPRIASRITLEITGVRVERLQDISEADAKAEGIYQYKDGGFKIYTPTTSFGTDHARRSFESLWESINGDDSWTSNPWVWVIEFKRVT